MGSCSPFITTTPPPMVALHLILLLVIFLVSSFGSGWLMHLYGYPVPKSLSSRDDYILLAMKLVLFTILVIVQLVILLLVGLNPLRL